MTGQRLNPVPLAKYTNQMIFCLDIASQVSNPFILLLQCQEFDAFGKKLCFFTTFTTKAGIIWKFDYHLYTFIA